MQSKDTAQENTTENNTNEYFGINADENAAGTTHLNDPVTDESEMEKLNEELTQQKDKFLRLTAEFDNYKRRSRKEWLEQKETAGKEVIQSLLDILDDCDRAEKQMKESDDLTIIKEGVQLIFNKLRNQLQMQGLNIMDSIGLDFDVDKHEAITELAADESKQGKVIDEVQKGYLLNGKIIRFAKVVVGK